MQTTINNMRYNKIENLKKNLMKSFRQIFNNIWRLDKEIDNQRMKEKIYLLNKI